MAAIRSSYARVCGESVSRVIGMTPLPDKSYARVCGGRMDGLTMYKESHQLDGLTIYKESIQVTPLHGENKPGKSTCPVLPVSAGAGAAPSAGPGVGVNMKKIGFHSGSNNKSMPKVSKKILRAMERRGKK
jgi:hypothetical protein